MTERLRELERQAAADPEDLEANRRLSAERRRRGVFGRSGVLEWFALWSELQRIDQHYLRLSARGRTALGMPSFGSENQGSGCCNF